MDTGPLITAVVAGLIASAACGVGALPVALPIRNIERFTGLGYAYAGGLMIAASVYNLILPGFQVGGGGRIHTDAAAVLPVAAGILAGALFLHLAQRLVPDDPPQAEGGNDLARWGGRTGLLIFVAMTVHSIPEGVAVGVGYARDAAQPGEFGIYVAVAIGIHNIPEGLAVAIPLRLGGASIWRCALLAFITSLPQPLFTPPAYLLSWVFQPIMPFLMGFAAGAMIFLVVLELIPDALEQTRPLPIAWSFIAGFCTMLLIQVLL